MQSKWSAAVALSFLFAAASARAATVYSNYDPSLPDTSAFPAPAVSGTNNAVGFGYNAVAVDFTPSANYTLDSISVSFEAFDGGNSFNFILSTDHAGAPGTVLESWSNVAIVSDDFPPTTFASPSHPLLIAGQTYWFAAYPGADTAFGGWITNDQGDTDSYDVSTDGTHWTNRGPAPTPAIDVEGSTPTGTPTPSAALAGAALLLLLGCSKQSTKPTTTAHSA